MEFVLGLIIFVIVYVKYFGRHALKSSIVKKHYNSLNRAIINGEMDQKILTIVTKENGNLAI